MIRQIFVNLPIQEIDKSIEFFAHLGFTFNPQFTDENATCMIIDKFGTLWMINCFVTT
jgi:uncharacterized protein